MKKLIAIVLSFCMLFTNFNAVYANPSNELELVGILEDADKVELIQNDYDYGEAYAVFGNLKHTIRWNKKTNEVDFKVENLKSKSVLESSTFNIEINEDFEPIGTIKYNGDEYNLKEIDVNPNTRMALTAVVGSALITYLIAISASVVILGVTYVLATEIASELRKKKPKHYQAAIRYSKKFKRNELFIGNSLGETGASGRLKAGNDVWSTSQAGAKKIAKLAGGNKEPIGAEKHGGGKPGYYWHYHTYNRKGGHSFF